jgi:hypothetical protein
MKTWLNRAMYPISMTAKILIIRNSRIEQDLKYCIADLN